MAAGRSLQRRFGERERKLLGKLFRALGTDNEHEAAAARGAIAGLLREFGKTWSDLIGLLGGDIDVLLDDLVRDIARLGSRDPVERANARRNIADLLTLHRKTWNDLADALSGSHEAWACKPQADDPPRVNPLALVAYLLEEHVAMRPHEYVGIALWVLHSHVYTKFAVTPRLVLRSPTANAGKTTLIDLLSRLAARAEKFDSITTAALYRLIDQTHPTLLIDEADNLGIALRTNGRLRAVFNSGHRIGGNVAITERGALRKFSTFAPLALALPEMSGLPRTLNSRSITVTMERATRPLKRFDAVAFDPAFDAAFVQIRLWQRDTQLEPLNPDPEMPIARNRFADNWRPLISIADALGWGERAREAMLIFAREFTDADAKINLLEDIRKIFDAQGADRLPSKELLDALHAQDDGDWQEFCGVRGDQHPHKLRGGELAAMLREFGIRLRSIWPLNRTARSKSAKGYRRAQFEDVWRRYCADGGTAAHTSVIKSLRLAGDDTV